METTEQDEYVRLFVKKETPPGCPSKDFLEAFIEQFHGSPEMEEDYSPFAARGIDECWVSRLNGSGDLVIGVGERRMWRLRFEKYEPNS